MKTECNAEPDDGRDTARIWTGFLYLETLTHIQDNYCKTDLDLAFLLNEINILRITAQIACQDSSGSFDELRADVRKHVDSRATKTAQKYFDQRRREWDHILKDELGH